MRGKRDCITIPYQPLSVVSCFHFREQAPMMTWVWDCIQVNVNKNNVRLHVRIDRADNVFMVVYLLGTGSFASRSLVQDKTTKRHGVPKDLQGGDLGSEQKDRSGDQQDVLEVTISSGIDARVDRWISTDLENAGKCQN